LLAPRLRLTLHWFDVLPAPGFQPGASASDSS